MSSFCFAPVNTTIPPKTEISPPFFAWKTQTQNVTTFHPFHQATALGSTMHCQSLPSLRLTHAAVKCREYTQKKGFLKLYTRQTCGKMLAKAQQWTWGRQMGYPLTWKANYGLEYKMETAWTMVICHSRLNSNTVAAKWRSWSHRIELKLKPQWNRLLLTKAGMRWRHRAATFEKDYRDFQ